jgi:50S ribosomal protein L16 3-hydroxylase
MKPVERLEPFDADRFLADFWQRRPCLIGGWLAPEPLSLDELLETAQRDGLPTRLIAGNQERADWTLHHGPLENDDLPDTRQDWTVLVQEMDKSSRAVESILDRFRQFVPDWMLDDIMISHAVPGGSVGAHVDAYDVFLVQAAGTRHWQLAEDFDPALDQRFEMALLKNWKPQTELPVAAGELLYLPPGIAHHGVATDECQTWSVGLRTPSGPELMFFLAESLALRESHGDRLRVTHPDPHSPSLVTPAVINQARGLMKAALELDDSELQSLLAQFLTRWRLWPREPGDDDCTELAGGLGEGRRIRLDSAARLALSGPKGQEVLTVNGELITCPSQLARELANTRLLCADWLDHPQALEQLIECGAVCHRFGHRSDRGIEQE